MFNYLSNDSIRNIVLFIPIDNVYYKNLNCVSKNISKIFSDTIHLRNDLQDEMYILRFVKDICENKNISKENMNRIYRDLYYKNTNSDYTIAYLFINDGRIVFKDNFYRLLYSSIKHKWNFVYKILQKKIGKNNLIKSGLTYEMQDL